MTEVRHDASAAAVYCRNIQMQFHYGGSQKLFVAQPSLSKVVKDLEKEFHITILRRSRHGISFTADGLKFLHFANQVLDASANMQDYFLHEKGDGEKFVSPFRRTITSSPLTA